MPPVQRPPDAANMKGHVLDMPVHDLPGQANDWHLICRILFMSPPPFAQLLRPCRSAPAAARAHHA
jgi:hypothetical protein